MVKTFDADEQSYYLPHNLVQAQYTMGIGGMTLRSLILSRLNIPYAYVIGHSLPISITEEDWHSFGGDIPLKSALDEVLGAKFKFSNNGPSYSMLSHSDYIQNENKIIVQINKDFLSACIDD